MLARLRGESERLAEHHRLQSALDMDRAAKHAVEVAREAHALQQLHDEENGDVEQAPAKVEGVFAFLELLEKLAEDDRLEKLKCILGYLPESAREIRTAESGVEGAVERRLNVLEAQLVSPPLV